MLEKETQIEIEQRTDLSIFSKKIAQIKTEIKKLIIGQDEMINLMLVALIADGHVLIEGVPGVAKTLSARILSRIINTDYQRIQFTPDLMPSDIIGTSVYNAKEGTFNFKKGPLFSNIVLIDEINRSPAKTQSALFEVMEERNITAEGTTYQLKSPFMVLATQNPVEHEGTYRLPEAQLDRFLFKINVDFPSLAEETAILKRYNTDSYIQSLEEIQACLTIEEVNEVINLSLN